MSIHRVAAVVEIRVHLWVGQHFRTSGFEPDSDTAEPDTQLPAAAAVEH